MEKLAARTWTSLGGKSRSQCWCAQNQILNEKIIRLYWIYETIWIKSTITTWKWLSPISPWKMSSWPFTWRKVLQKRCEKVRERCGSPKRSVVTIKHCMTLQLCLFSGSKDMTRLKQPVVASVVIALGIGQSGYKWSSFWGYWGGPRSLTQHHADLLVAGSKGEVSRPLTFWCSITVSQDGYPRRLNESIWTIQRDPITYPRIWKISRFMSKDIPNVKKHKTSKREVCVCVCHATVPPLRCCFWCQRLLGGGMGWFCGQTVGFNKDEIKSVKRCQKLDVEFWTSISNMSCRRIRV